MDCKPLITRRKTPHLRISPKSITNKSCTKITKIPSQRPKATPISKKTHTPSTIVFADTSSFKHVVQMLTGSPKATQKASEWLVPIKDGVNKQQSKTQTSKLAAMEENIVVEKMFYLHSPPVTTSKGTKPRLLPLFPMASRVFSDC